MKLTITASMAVKQSADENTAAEIKEFARQVVNAMEVREQ